MTTKGRIETRNAWIVTEPDGTCTHVTIGGLADLAVKYGYVLPADGILEAHKIVAGLRGADCSVDFSPKIEEPEEDDDE